MEGGSISQRKSHTAQFKLEVVEVAKEKGNRETGRLFNVGESNVYCACSFFTNLDLLCR
jgi:hypothetical protein